MNNIAININNISKVYKIGEKVTYGSMREELMKFFRSRLRRTVPTKTNGTEKGADNNSNYIWSLRDISFDINRGEIVGIIGRNGAGKSTLLKIIAGITEPTEGSINIYGRIGSLLEVGTGFHQELTGRENIYLNGAILGMKRAEIDRKFDEIVAFSEVEKFIDTPVKYYSSGMGVRLGFSVAAHLEPEILLIDEVLAVGDAAFQKKCLGKLDNVAISDGRTVFFVSHNMTSVLSLCKKTLFIENGKMVSYGRTDEVIEQYLSSIMDGSAIPLESREDRTGDGTALITSLSIENLDSQKAIRPGCQLKIKLGYRSQEQLKHHQFLLKVRDFRTDAIILRLDSDMISGLPETLPREGTISCITDNMFLSPGRCVVDAEIRKGSVSSDLVKSAAFFDVEAEDLYGTGRLPDREQAIYLVEYTFSLDK